MPRALSPLPLVALILALLTCGSAWAGVGEVRVSSALPPTLRGTFSAEMDEGSLLALEENATGVRRLHGATGRVTVYTWQSLDVAQALTQRMSDAAPKNYRVENATLELTLDHEYMGLRVAPEGGVLMVRGEVSGSLMPLWLEQPFRRERNAGLPVPREAERVEVSWDAGWMFVGDFPDGPTDQATFPSFTHASLSLSGQVRAQVLGGNLSFVDAEGQRQNVRLGAWTSPAGDASGSTGPRVVTVSRLIFDGAVAAADLPLRKAWGMAAPSMKWTLQGDGIWQDARGAGIANGKRVEFADSEVAMAVDARLDVQRPVLPSAARPEVSWLVSGDIRSIQVDGQVVTADPQTDASMAAVAATSGATLLLAALLSPWGQGMLGRAFGVLYTRIDSSRVLDHPTRKRMHLEALASPGIHQRELHRRVGGAWGPFTFHLRVLLRSGHLRLRVEGGYTFVFPGGTRVEDAPPAIPHPLAKAIYDALPPDGEPVPLRDLALRVSASREAVRHHVRGLVERGLVDRVALPWRRRGLARRAR